MKRRRRPRKQRKSTPAATRRKLWSLFAAYVKERDGNVCISCGRQGLEGKNWQAGHMIRSEGHPATRYDPKNVHSQCGGCNLYARGNVPAYVAAFLERYGAGEFRRIEAQSREFKAWRVPEMLEMIAALERGGAEYEMFYAERYGLKEANRGMGTVTPPASLGLPEL